MSLVKTAGIVVVGLVLGTGTTMFLLAKATNSYIARLAAFKAEAEEAKQPEKPWDFWTIEMENLSNELKEEKARLKQREDALAQREATVVNEQKELAKTRKQLEALRVAIDQRLIEVSEGEAANLKQLAATYSGMNPKAALAIYKEMDDTTLVKLLSLMKKDVVKQTFEEMSRQSAADPALAKRAATLSEKLRLLKTAKPQAPSN
jgi:flagellar motility protein MotE (MotC chaperone)